MRRRKLRNTSPAGDPGPPAEPAFDPERDELRALAERWHGRHPIGRWARARLSAYSPGAAPGPAPTLPPAEESEAICN